MASTGLGRRALAVGMVVVLLFSFSARPARACGKTWIDYHIGQFMASVATSAIELNVDGAVVTYDIVMAAKKRRPARGAAFGELVAGLLQLLISTIVLGSEYSGTDVASLNSDDASNLTMVTASEAAKMALGVGLAIHGIWGMAAREVPRLPTTWRLSPSVFPVEGGSAPGLCVAGSF